VAVSTNADWYRAFCSAHKTTRRKYPKPRTIIKRVDTTRILEYISQYGENFSRKGLYYARLMEAIESYAVTIKERYGLKLVD